MSEDRGREVELSTGDKAMLSYGATELHGHLKYSTDVTVRLAFMLGVL